MTQDEAFLQAILATPDDDTPRLIYADWLEERGNPRGDFIRVQCERAQMPEKDVEFTCKRIPADSGHALAGHALLGTFRLVCGGPDCRLVMDMGIHRPNCRWNFLRQREEELLNQHAHEWLFVLPSGFRPILPEAVTRTFRRGFVSRLQVDYATFRTQARDLFRKAPINDVRFSDIHPALHPDGRWYWEKSRHVGRLHYVPRILWPPWIDEGALEYEVETADEARDDLSSWSVWFGREQAGLPIPPPHYCERCLRRATQWSQDRIELSSRILGEIVYRKGLKHAWCDEHAPSNSAGFPA